MDGLVGGGGVDVSVEGGGEAGAEDGEGVVEGGVLGWRVDDHGLASGQGWSEVGHGHEYW